MKVSDIKGKGPVDEITLKLESIAEPRDVRGGSLRVADADASDETGKITLTLWNQDIDKVKTGDTIKITKGWVGEYQGKFQLSSGKFGQIEVLESGEPTENKSNPQVDAAIDEDII